MRLCVGDDWAQDHHDVEVMDEAGKVLATRRLPEGVAGIEQLHELIGQFVPADGAARRCRHPVAICGTSAAGRAARGACCYFWALS